MNETIKELDESYIKELIELHKKSIVPIWKKLKREYNLEEIKEYLKDTFSKGKIFGYFDSSNLAGCIGVVMSIDLKPHSLELQECKFLAVLRNIKFLTGGSNFKVLNLGSSRKPLNKPHTLVCGKLKVFLIYEKHNLGEIRHVLVNSKFQGRGIGKKLMNYAEDFCRNKIKKLRLEVLIGNDALSFYEKMGYKKKAYVRKLAKLFCFLNIQKTHKFKQSFFDIMEKKI